MGKQISKIKKPKCDANTFIDGYETVEEYLIERSNLHIPTWSERFLAQRIKWRDFKLAPEELRRRTLERLKAAVLSYERSLARAKQQLADYENGEKTKA